MVHVTIYSSTMDPSWVIMKQLKEDSAVKKVICYMYLYVSMCGFV